jgi:hypothetical protein
MTLRAFVAGAVAITCRRAQIGLGVRSSSVNIDELLYHGGLSYDRASSTDLVHQIVRFSGSSDTSQSKLLARTTCQKVQHWAQVSPGLQFK